MKSGDSMGIYIKGIEMPTRNHEIIIRIQSDGRVLDQWGHRLNLEPTAVPVPPHGDLINRDTLMQQIEHDTPLSEVYEKTMRRYLNNAPTVIPAESEVE